MGSLVARLAGGGMRVLLGALNLLQGIAVTPAIASPEYVRVGFVRTAALQLAQQGNGYRVVKGFVRANDFRQPLVAYGLRHRCAP